MAFSYILIVKLQYDTPGLVCNILIFLLRMFLSLYIIYERVQNHTQTILGRF